MFSAIIEFNSVVVYLVANLKFVNDDSVILEKEFITSTNLSQMCCGQFTSKISNIKI